MVRLSLFIALSLVAVAFGGYLPADYVQWQGRIVGGAPATTGQIPYQVSLRTNDHFHFCGGSLINNRWVVSAAHCTVGDSPNTMIIVVGTLDRESGGVTYRISRIVNHPDYQPNQNRNDLSLVQSASDIAFGDLVKPIGLSSQTVGAVSVLASGWGQTASGSAADKLQFLQVTTMLNDDCRKEHVETGASSYIYESVICTTSPTGQGMCFGDSGGPIVSQNVLVGAVSWGIPCARGKPDVFTRVSYYNSWILETIK